MGYRKYAKDYEIEYVERLGSKRQKPVRIYVGPYYRFLAPDKEIRQLKGIYSLGLMLLAISLLIPLSVDTTATRTWYIQVPAACIWIPWLLAVGALWRLFTAKGRVDREHYDMLYPRMSGAAVCMLLLSLISFVGALVLVFRGGAGGLDILVLLCCLMTLLLSLMLFCKRKGLRMQEEENPEKPQGKKQ